MLRIVTPWDSQPQEVVGVDWGNPITRGLLAAHTGGPTFGPSVGLSPGSPVATSPNANRVTTYGPGWIGDGTARVLEIPIQGISPTSTPFTLVVLSAPSSTAEQTVACLTSKSGNNRCQIETNTGGSAWVAFTNTGNFVGSISPALGRWDVVGTNFGMGAANASVVYVNGVAGTPSSVSAGADTYNTLAIGARWNASYGLYAANSTALVAVWNRLLTAAEHAALAANPWSLFAPRTIWVPVSSASSGTSFTITPSGGISFGGTSVDVKGKILTVSGGVTFSGTGSATFASGGTTYTITPTGGLVFAGSGVSVNSKVFLPSGGITFGGSGLDLRTKIIDIGGGVSLGGTGNMTSNTSTGPVQSGERTKVGVGT